MKEKITTIILVIVFVGLLVVVNGMLKKEDSNNLANVKTENKVSIAEIETNESDDEKNTVVIEVTEETFEEEVLKSDKKVLIDFYADWCGPCKTLSPIVEEVAEENPDIKVVKIDVDASENLAYKYKAYSIPTLVVIENGEEVNRSVGAIPKEEVLELVK